LNLALKNGPYLAKNSVNKIWSIWANFGKKLSNARKRFTAQVFTFFFQTNRINLKLEETKIARIFDFYF
jgi:hypothetical protein